MKYVYAAVIVCCSFCARSQTPDWAWARGSSGPGDTEVRHMAVDPSGNVYITGYFSGGSVAFAATTLTNSGAAGSAEYFLAKYDRTGNLLWAKRAVGSDDDEGLSVTFDGAGNVYTTGLFESPTITFGTVVLTNNSTNGLSDVFVVKYNSSGSVLWASSFGGAQEETGNSIVSDAAGNTYLIGNFESLSAQFGAYGVINGGATDIFVAKFNSGGTPLWARRIGGGQIDNGRDVAIDAGGNIVLTGDFNSTSLTTYSPALTSAGGYDFFWARYDAAGNIISAARYGGSGDESAYSITTSTAGNFFIGGSFGSSSLGLGSLSLSNSGNKDMFFAKFSSTGTPQWATKSNANITSTVRDMVASPAGDLYAAGFFDVSSVTFSSTAPLNNSGGSDGFLVKFDGASGAGIWAKQTLSPGQEKLRGIGVDGQGYVIVGGSYDKTLTLGSDMLAGTNQFSAFVAKLCFAPSGPVSATSATVCSGLGANLTALLPAGTSGTWYNTPSGGTPLLSGSSTFSANTPGTYYVAARDTNSGCGMYSSTRVSATLAVHPPVNASVTISGHTLTAAGQGTVTTWYDCNKKAPIAGQTGGSYVLTTSGSYAVVMHRNGCADTSSCNGYSYTPGGTPTVVINTSLQENRPDGLRVSAFPNPNAGTFTFRSTESGRYKLFNILGETLATIELTEENKKGLVLSGFESGIYFISDIHGTTCVRIIVNR